MKRLHAVGIALLFAGFACGGAHAAARHVTPGSMDKNSRELFQESMTLGDQAWDKDTKLISTGGVAAHESVAIRHMVRESSWYAFGLLVRDGKGDRQKAAEILEAVLKEQYLVAGTRWYGTFRRSPEEAEPKAEAVMWKEYDPNWREFIGCTFAMILIEYPDRIPAELARQMYASIDHALEGERKEGRLVPSYSNIALMYGFLWDFAAVHDQQASWKEQSAQWTESVYRLFKENNSFFEYNSPTYYGVDLYGLALWRDYGSSERIRTMGSEMEGTLWRDIAVFYQPKLRNVSGPYDRSYGMDMESYVSVVGVWLRTVLSAGTAPLPRIEASTDHVADAWFAPQFVVLGAKIPSDAMTNFQRFQGEHLVRRQITKERTATAWIGKEVIYGGEFTSKTKDAGTTTQFHPATVQWRTPSGKVGWIRLIECPLVDATADEHGLTIVATGDIRLRLFAPNSVPSKISSSRWELPGLNVEVSSDAKGFTQTKSGDALDVTYSGMTKMTLSIGPVTLQDKK